MQTDLYIDKSKMTVYSFEPPQVAVLIADESGRSVLEIHEDGTVKLDEAALAQRHDCLLSRAMVNLIAHVRKGG